jgi:short-subunit dehydrogenase
MDLTGQTILVTGSDGGIGRAIVEELAQRDAQVLSGMRDVDSFELVGGAVAREVRPVRIELSSREAIEQSLDELGDTSVDVLVNNAGQFTGGLFERGDLGEFYELLQVNVAALVHLTYRLLPGMLSRERGKIVNNASIAGYAHFPGAAVYSASKSAVVGFSEALRRELEESPLSVLHLVTPGVETDMLDQVRADYEPYVKDTSKLDGVEPGEWAEKIVRAIEDDDEVLNPTGAERLAKLASRGPAGLLDATLGRVFDR